MIIEEARNLLAINLHYFDFTFNFYFYEDEYIILLSFILFYYFIYHIIYISYLYILIYVRYQNVSDTITYHMTPKCNFIVYMVICDTVTFLCFHIKLRNCVACRHSYVSVFCRNVTLTSRNVFGRHSLILIFVFF